LNVEAVGVKTHFIESYEFGHMVKSALANKSATWRTVAEYVPSGLCPGFKLIVTFFPTEIIS